MLELGVVEDHMPFLNVAKKRYCYLLVLRLQEGKDVDQL
jgi:hypothetical protein